MVFVVCGLGFLWGFFEFVLLEVLDLIVCFLNFCKFQTTLKCHEGFKKIT